MFLRLTILGALCFGAGAAEPPFRDDLLIHLDAANQTVLRQQLDLPGTGQNQAVDTALPSGSNPAPIFSQPAPDRRPTLQTDGSTAYWKFDGKDDFLAAQSSTHQADELTLFILAAPAENPGFFTGIFGSSRFGRNDYTSGLNLDFGPGSTPTLSTLNVEGAGAIGFRDLLEPGFFNASERPFGDFHLFTVRVSKTKIDTFLDGLKGGERERTAAPIGLEQLVLGGRFYSNDPTQPPYAQGHFRGAIAECLLYRRALTDQQRSQVEEQLLAKTAPLNALLRGAKGHALDAVKDAPIVQMFVPGFTVHELPLKIGNLTNVRYRHDGKLVGQGYDGRIYLLTDSDGDGLEDKASFFWEEKSMRSPIGIALTGKNDPRGDGVFIANKGKVSFIIDADRDGKAEREQIIAGPWPEPFHGVDALGLAVDPKDGSIYFGRGCANFVEAYLIDKNTGQSGYRIEDERGTIQRISPDFASREVICTGVRYPCALAFNKAGDLFATDQEGATWLPNGNPFDELLHIQRGKHYGFPPRHPKHLPSVIDEPAVYEYGPQHQSTVGLVFNESVHGGPVFGPAYWEGDALVCGESRGKLYRTKLSKTPAGYVAKNELIASLGMLAVDACISPQGDLVIACHSGPPDWGTGPAGEGRIFKIRYSSRTLPQPVHAWAARPDEFRIAFDRALNPSDWNEAARSKIKIEAGEFVAAGDRFETIRPGYQIVRDQMSALRRWVDLLGLSLSADARTLILRVPRQSEPVTYAITLPLPAAWQQPGGIRQHSELDLALRLDGISASISSAGEQIQAILPHASLKASREFTRGSSDHDRFFARLSNPTATIAFAGAIDISNPFIPTVQPGSKLDWDQSTDPFASALFTIESDYQGSSPIAAGSNRWQQLSLTPTKITTPDGFGLRLARDGRQSSLPLTRFRLPWVTEKKAATNLAAKTTRTDVHGNWLRGRRVFLTDGGCASCHQLHGEGFALGPDLRNLIHRDRESVLQDILDPSATINPDHPAMTVTLDDGTEHHGLVRLASAEKVLLALPAGAQMEWPRSKVRRLDPMRDSLMPRGLEQQLSKEQLEDLLTYLLSEPLEPAQIQRHDPGPPPPRPIAEVEKILGHLRPLENPAPLRILLVAGPKDHGLDEHDYPLWLDRWSRLLGLADNVKITSTSSFPTESQLSDADVAVFYNANPGWDTAKAASITAYHQRGGGAVYIHYAVDGGKDPALAAARAGLAFTLGSKFRHGAMQLRFTKNHPITQGLPSLDFVDETYWNMRGDLGKIEVLGTCDEEGKPTPQLWTLQVGQGRVVGCIPGHYSWTFDDPLFRVLLLRSICWAAKQPEVDRLAPLATIGARR